MGKLTTHKVIVQTGYRLQTSLSATDGPVTLSATGWGYIAAMLGGKVEWTQDHRDAAKFPTVRDAAKWVRAHAVPNSIGVALVGERNG